jgi:hypothetical protein
LKKSIVSGDLAHGVHGFLAAFLGVRWQIGHNKALCAKLIFLSR